MSQKLNPDMNQHPEKRKGCFTIFLFTVLVAFTALIAYYLCYQLGGQILNWRYGNIATGASMTGLPGLITAWFLIGEILTLLLTTDKLLPASNTAGHEELKKFAKWKIPVAAVGIAIMLACIPFFANQSTSYNENGLTVQGPFSAKTYEWSDVITETVSWNKDTGMLGFTVRMKDGKTYSLLTDPFQMNDGFKKKYGGIYHYLVVLDADLYNAGLRNKKLELGEGMEEYFKKNDPETWESYIKTLVEPNP